MMKKTKEKLFSWLSIGCVAFVVAAFGVSLAISRVADRDAALAADETRWVYWDERVAHAEDFAERQKKMWAELKEKESKK